MSDVTLKIENEGEYTVPEGKKLLLALKEEAGIDQLHACGGKGKCTTCKVEFVAGEPEKMTVAEKNILKERGLDNVRLSCQILCEEDMDVRIISRLSQSERQDCGTEPTDDIIPEPEWTQRSAE